MSEIKSLTIGTRGSALALKQTELVIKALEANYPALQITTKIITTKGDKNLSPIPLDTIGKAWFTEELEEALLSGEIDLAVHSLKDLPPETPKGLATTAVLKREDARDVLISRSNVGLDQLPKGAIVGTDSIRRKAELLHRRPDLIIKSVRGNVDTRLCKLQQKDYDALMLAAAGLSRLGKIDAVTQYLDPNEFVPAIGQGVLAAEARVDHTELWQLIKSIQDPETLEIVKAEQMFSKVVGGGCKLPVGCYAYFEGEEVTLHAMVGSMDALKMVTKSAKGPRANAVSLAKQLAKDLLREDIFSQELDN